MPSRELLQLITPDKTLSIVVHCWVKSNKCLQRLLSGESNVIHDLLATFFFFFWVVRGDLANYMKLCSVVFIYPGDEMAYKWLLQQNKQNPTEQNVNI